MSDIIISVILITAIIVATVLLGSLKKKLKYIDKEKFA